MAEGLIGNFENSASSAGNKTAPVRNGASSAGNAASSAGNGGEDDPEDDGEDDLGTATNEPRGSADPLEPYTHVPGVGRGHRRLDHQHGPAAQPGAGLGAAITVVGTLIGRRVAGPTRSATHLYVVTVAPATAGKDHPRRCILPLLEAANAGTHVHLGDIASQSGFNRAMKDKPAEHRGDRRDRRIPRAHHQPEVVALGTPPERQAAGAMVAAASEPSAP